MLLNTVLQGEVAVVDVRDHDYVGGHISGSLHRPNDDFEEIVGDMADALGSAARVVFLCMTSQVTPPNPCQPNPVADPWAALCGPLRAGVEEEGY